jgi:hypothetical protein
MADWQAPIALTGDGGKAYREGISPRIVPKPREPWGRQIGLITLRLAANKLKRESPLRRVF